QLDVRSPLACQEARVESVIPPAPRATNKHRTRIRDDARMPQLFEETRDPRRMRPDLHHHATPRTLFEIPRDPSDRRDHRCFADALPRGTHLVRATRSIAEI